MKMTVQSIHSVPTGLHDARFIGCETVTHPEYGAGIEWQWEITAGNSQGERVNRRTGPEPSARNACGRIIQGFLGRELEAGEEIDPRDLVGTACKVFVAQTESGWPRVESVTCV